MIIESITKSRSRFWFAFKNGNYAITLFTYVSVNSERGLILVRRARTLLNLSSDEQRQCGDIDWRVRASILVELEPEPSMQSCGPSRHFERRFSWIRNQDRSHLSWCLHDLLHVHMERELWNAVTIKTLGLVGLKSYLGYCVAVVTLFQCAVNEIQTSVCNISPFDLFKRVLFAALLALYSCWFFWAYALKQADNWWLYGLRMQCCTSLIESVTVSGLSNGERIL